MIGAARRRPITYAATIPKMMNATVRRVSHLLPHRPYCPRLNAFHFTLNFSDLSSLRARLVMPFISSFPHSAPSAGTVTSSTGPWEDSSSRFAERGEASC